MLIRVLYPATRRDLMLITNRIKTPSLQALVFFAVASSPDTSSPAAGYSSPAISLPAVNSPASSSSAISAASKLKMNAAISSSSANSAASSANYAASLSANSAASSANYDASLSANSAAASRFSRRQWKAPPPVTLSYDASASPFTSANYAAAPTTPSSSFAYAAAPKTTSPAHKKKNSDASTTAGSAHSAKKRASSPSEEDASKKVCQDLPIPSEKVPPHHVSLGDNILLKVTDFTGTVRVHVRTFKFDGDKLSATKAGVTMSPLTYLMLVQEHYSTRHQKEIKVFNRELFVNCHPSMLGDTTYTLQQLAPRKDGGSNLLPTSVTLTYKQFDALVECKSQIWRSIEQHMFGKAFQETVLQLRGAASETIDLTEDLSTILVNTVKSAVQENIGKVYFCQECHLPYEEQPQNQMGHACCNITEEAIWSCHYENALALVQPKALAESFVKACGDLTPNIGKKFLQSIDAAQIVQSAENMH